MSKRWVFAIVVVLFLLGVGVLFRWSLSSAPSMQADNAGNLDEAVTTLHELSIESLSKGTYPGSELTIEETLSPGSNYTQQIVSYQSEGNKIYALLTIPQGEKPPTGPASTRGDSTRGGWPAIVFNHGYIAPTQYQTTERYVAYVSGFASRGYIVLKPDYRGHGKSEGEAVGAYGSNGYTIDVLNALASLKKHTDVDPNRIGMWGHSLGGFITLRAMVVSPDIKAGVIWAGVVGSYEDLLNNWRRAPSITPFPTPTGTRRWRQLLVEQYGTPEANPAFWNSISATSFVKDISGPLALHHGLSDSSVPPLFSEKLEKLLQAAGKTVEYFEYPGNDHNLSQSFGVAMQRSVDFFDRYLKIN